MDGMLGIVRPGGGSGRDDVSIQVGGWAEFVEHGDLYVAGAAHLVNRADLGADRRENPLHVVADLYRRFGIDAVQRLEGQYCLALWDSVEKSLLLAVDRFATRALYYAAGRNGVVFGSSLRDTSAETDRRIDPQAILEYLLYQAVPAPRTAYRGVCKLPAGHLLVADARGIRLQRYWEMTYPESSDGSAADWARALRAEIEAAVGRYAEAEGEADRVGCFLSGRHRQQHGGRHARGSHGKADAHLLDRLCRARLGRAGVRADRRALVRCGTARVAPRCPRVARMSFPVSRPTTRSPSATPPCCRPTGARNWHANTGST